MKRLTITNEASRNTAIDVVGALDLRKPYELIINIISEVRSVSQNRLYWLWLTCLMDETGHSRTDLHTFFKDYFLPSNIEVIKSVEIVKSTSTTSLSKKQFSWYLERIHQFAISELDCYLPWPNDPVFADFEFKYKNYI